MSNNYLMPYKWHRLFYKLFSVACIFAYSMTIILSIMLALCLMLSGTYYAQNYASIIGWCLENGMHEIDLWGIMRCLNPLGEVL